MRWLESIVLVDFQFKPFTMRFHHLHWNGLPVRGSRHKCLCHRAADQLFLSRRPLTENTRTFSNYKMHATEKKTHKTHTRPKCTKKRNGMEWKTAGLPQSTTPKRIRISYGCNATVLEHSIHSFSRLIYSTRDGEETTEERLENINRIYTKREECK